MKIMRYLPNGTWMQKADEDTIQNIGIPSMVLMERAALKTIDVMKEKKICRDRCLIVCGSGNNGGDGFAIARLLHEEGKSVCAVFVGSESSMSEECRRQRAIAENLGVLIVTDIPQEEYTVVIDAVFGVGLSRPIVDRYAEVIAMMNQKRGQKVAVDIPSGVSSFDGSILGTAFCADLTVSFACEKLGTVLFPGHEYSGEVVPVEIGISTRIFQDDPDVCYTLEKEDLSAMLPKRQKNSHKGTYGKILMITGSRGMSGAAYLSAKAAYITGGGLVQIYTEESNRVILQQLLPEAIVSTYTAYEEETLASLLGWADVVCIGCGLGKSEVSGQILEYVLKHLEMPCVVDADGLNLLAQRKDLLLQKAKEIVLTPHMKEMAGMLGCTIPELADARFLKLQEFVRAYGVVCALKDARTLVAEQDRQMFLNTAGNSAMAKAGSGDVLAGVITGLLAQHMSAYEAAVLGVYLHACGGDEARESCGAYSVLAQDLTEGIKICIKETKKGR